MAVYDLYSKRKKRANGEVGDVYQYTSFPSKLRVQIIRIFDGVLGNEDESLDGYSEVGEAYCFVVDVLCREHGWLVLPHTFNAQTNRYVQLKNFFLNESDIDLLLDAVEFALRVVESWTRRIEYRNNRNFDRLADDALEEVNVRLRENGVGYAYENGEMVRVESQLLHAEVIKPAIKLLNVPGYEGVQDEFLAAHEHYRHGNSKEAMIDCLKAFESMMKVICGKRGWAVGGRGTVGDLIKTVFDNKLVPDFWQSQFTAIRSTLESGVPTARNKLAGHGQGAEPIEVPADIVAYMLHMTGATIVLLSERDKALG